MLVERADVVTVTALVGFVVAHESYQPNIPPTARAMKALITK
jgi:hypothetical protein